MSPFEPRRLFYQSALALEDTEREWERLEKQGCV